MEQREIIARGFIAALCRAMEKDNENSDMIPYWDDLGNEEKKKTQHIRLRTNLWMSFRVSLS